MSLLCPTFTISTTSSKSIISVIALASSRLSPLCSGRACSSPGRLSLSILNDILLRSQAHEPLGFIHRVGFLGAVSDSFGYLFSFRQIVLFLNGFEESSLYRLRERDSFAFCVGVRDLPLLVGHPDCNVHFLRPPS